MKPPSRLTLTIQQLLTIVVWCQALHSSWAIVWCTCCKGVCRRPRGRTLKKQKKHKESRTYKKYTYVHTNDINNINTFCVHTACIQNNIIWCMCMYILYLVFTVWINTVCMHSAYGITYTYDVHIIHIVQCVQYSMISMQYDKITTNYTWKYIQYIHTVWYTYSMTRAIW